MTQLNQYLIFSAILLSGTIFGPRSNCDLFSAEPDDSPAHLTVGNPELARQLLKSFEESGLMGVQESIDRAPDEDWYEALDSLEAIADKHPDARKMLVQLATSPGEFSLQYRAAYALREIENEDPEVIKALIITADLERDDVDETVLERLGKRVELFLRAGARNASPELRRNSIGLLAKTELDQELLYPIYRKALQDTDPSVRRRAAMVLVEQEKVTPEVASTLVECLKVEPKFDPRFGRIIDDYPLQSAIESCSRLAFAPLISTILDQDSPQRVRRLGVEILGEIAGRYYDPVHLSPSFEPLHAALDSFDPRARQWAALALASTHERAIEVVPKLLPLATRPGPLQRDAVVALGKLESVPEIFPERIALSLLSLVTSSEDEIVEEAVAALRRKRLGPQAMAKVLELIQQDEHRVKMAEIVISNSWKSQFEPKLIPYLIEYLLTLNSYELENALEVFTSWERKGAEALAETALNSELDVETRIKFLHALARNLRHGDDVGFADQHLPALAKLLNGDHPELAQAAAVPLAVAEYEEVSLVSHLIAGLKSEDYNTKSEAERGIEARASEGDAIATTLLESLPHQEEDTQKEWLQLLGSITKNSQVARSAMLDRFLRGEPTGNWRTSLSGLDRSIVPRLLRIIDGDDDAARTRAIRLLDSMIGAFEYTCNCSDGDPKDGLAEFGLEGIPPGLVAVLDANDIQLRKSAAMLLRRFDPHHPDAMDTLLDVLERGPIRQRFSVTAKSLREYGPRLKPHAHRLIDLLDDPERQSPAADALAGLGPEAEVAMPKLLELIDNDDPIYWADDLLRAIGPRAKEAEAILAKRFFDLHHSKFVAETYAAIDGSLELIQPQIEARLADSKTRLETLEVLGVLAVTNDVSHWFRAALDSEDLEFRYYAAKVLGNYHAPPVAGTFQPLLEMTKHPRPELRSAAATALGRQSEDAATTVSTLSRMLTEDEDIRARIQAAESLIRLGEKASPAVPSLIAVLHQEDVDIPATEALGEIGPDAAPAVDEFKKILMKPLDAQGSIHHVRLLHSTILETLIKIGPSAKAIVPTLLEYRQVSAARRSSQTLSEAIWTLDPEIAEQQGIENPSKTATD